MAAGSGPVALRALPESLPEDLPSRLARASDEVRSARVRLDVVVAEARAAGYSWDRLAALTGLNRETLRRKHGKAPGTEDQAEVV